MTDDPAVRSVRVAVALCDRFADLLKGPTQVHARKQQGALVGFSGNQDDLSMRIGEAQQLYPEIWRHLDDARKAFAERGVDVSAFDAVRAEEGDRLGAAVDVQHEKHGVGRYAVHEHTKSANFNEAGLARARKASDALMRATPTIDWAAIAKAEANDPAAAAFRRSARNKRLVMFGLLALVLASPFLYVLYARHQERVAMERRRTAEPAEVKVVPLSAAEQRELATTVTQLRASIAAARKSWSTAMAPDVLAAVKPGSGACAFRFVPPPPQAADAYITSGDADPTKFGTQFVAYAKDHPIPDAWLARAESMLAFVAGRLAENKADRLDAVRVNELEPYTTFVVIDRNSEAEVTATAPKIAYTPGEVVARGYVYSLRDGKVVCATAIDVKNAPADPHIEGVRRAADARELLHRDLEVRIRQALASGLHAAS